MDHSVIKKKRSERDGNEHCWFQNLIEISFVLGKILKALTC